MKIKMDEMKVIDTSKEEDDDDDDVISESEDSNDEEDEDEDTDGFDDENDDDGLEEEEEGEEVYDNRKRRIEDEQEEHSSKVAKIDIEDKKLYKLPTVDELNRLRETQMLYHSNLFRLQMEELLSEASMKNKHRLHFTEWLNQFSSYVKSLPSSPEYPLHGTKWLKEKNIVDPLSLPEIKGSFQFMAPRDVKFIGSFAAGTIVTTDESVDVMLLLPKEIVQYKDFKEGKWLIKRSRYLSWLAVHLREKSDLVTSVNWTSHLGNTKRPILQVTPSGGIGKKWKVNLFPVPDSESLKLPYFSPAKWTVTSSWYFGEEAVEEEKHEATPHCNWNCGVDLVMQDHLQLISDNVCQQSNLIQGIKLVKIWMSQRGLCKGPRRISGHVVVMFVIHLLQTRKINSQMSGYQVFRTVIVTLDTVDWSTKGICMRNALGEDALPLEELHNLFEVVFMDPSGMVNLTADLMVEDFQMVKHETRLALDLLGSSSADSFESLFMKKLEYFQYCDQIISISLKNKDLKRILEKHSNVRHQTLDHLGDLRYPAWSCILKTLKKALGDRVMLFVPKKDPTPVWSIEEAPPKPNPSLVVGFIINEAAAKALLTKGPSVEDPECANFRKFWGEKSNLRRFQDGSFNEAVLWGNVKQSVADRRLIPGIIAKYILNFQYNVAEESFHYICGQTESVLRMNHCTVFYEYGTGEESTALAIQAFDSLSQKLRSLDLPLKVSAVQSTSEVCRHSRVFPPIAKAIDPLKKGLETVGIRMQFTDSFKETPFFNYAIEVNVFLETSGKWPDDLVAIQAIKAEFYKTMASLLSDDGITVLAFPKFLQILWNGYVFHVKVCYRREIYLNRLIENSEGLLREQDTDAAMNLEIDLEILPRLTTALASVNADYPSYNGGVRLAKRWLGSQLLLPHIPHLVVDLLVAHLCVNPAPYDAPNTPHSLFLRFLALLAQTDWKTVPVLINFRDTFAVEDITELNRKFTSERESLPHMFIATPYELRGLAASGDPSLRYKLSSFWTKEAPSPPITYRCKQLASASLDIVTSNILKTSFDIKVIFRPCMDDFDVRIILKIKQLSRRKEVIDLCFGKKDHIHPYSYSSEEAMPIVMFDPAELYLKELQAAFNHLALFFYDEHGGNVIGVVWKPPALQGQDFKITSIQGHRILGIKNIKQIPNMEAILADFEIMGAGLVDRVVINNKT